VACIGCILLHYCELHSAKCVSLSTVINKLSYNHIVDFGGGGLVVSVLVTGHKVSRFKTPRSMDFKGDKIRSTPSFGGEVKPSVPCRRFTEQIIPTYRCETQC
jgi:hypothetical protein